MSQVRAGGTQTTTHSFSDYERLNPPANTKYLKDPLGQEKRNPLRVYTPFEGMMITQTLSKTQAARSSRFDQFKILIRLCLSTLILKLSSIFAHLSISSFNPLCDFDPTLQLPENRL